MRTFEKECEELASLNTFDPMAFEGNEDVPQDLCSFVLSLALIYNDCKNAMYAAYLLRDAKPEGQFQLNGLWATWSGIDWHLTRLFISHVHELFELIRNHRGVIDHPFFVKVVKQVHGHSREAWRSLINVADDASPKDEFGRILLLIRNKIVFHYDPKGIYRGFRNQFLDPGCPQQRAYVSRGLSMSQTRFYFADVAVQGYFQEIQSTIKGTNLSRKVMEIIESLNFALIGIVDRFIQLRGFAYREVKA
jgi:hypothetical protein